MRRGRVQNARGVSRGTFDERSQGERDLCVCKEEIEDEMFKGKMNGQGDGQVVAGELKDKKLY